MDTAIDAVLAGYDERAANELALMQELTPEELMRRVDEFLIPIGPDTGKVLNMLIRSSRARTILELGTSYGYSTIFLAEAARATGGKVISVDISADKQRYAEEHLRAAGLSSFVEFVTCDARDFIASFMGVLDFVLIDLWKDLYIPCFDLVHPKLSEGAFVAADTSFSRSSSARRWRPIADTSQVKPDLNRSCCRSEAESSLAGTPAEPSERIACSSGSGSRFEDALPVGPRALAATGGGSIFYRWPSPRPI
jgi:predicted O-methyltransferase YrrM